MNIWGDFYDRTSLAVFYLGLTPTSCFFSFSFNTFINFDISAQVILSNLSCCFNLNMSLHPEMKVETETEMEMEADIKKTQSEEMMNRLGLSLSLSLNLRAVTLS